MHYYIDGLKKYAVFKGRATRPEYWYFVLFSFIINIALSIISKLFGDQKNYLGDIYNLIILIPGMALAVRRLHDIGKSGWMILINLIPIVGWIWFIILACKKGEPNDNKFGSNPKNASTVIPPNPGANPNII